MTGGQVVRELTSTEAGRYAAARLRAVDSQVGCPYFATGIFALTPFAVDGLGTFAVDDTARVYVDPVLFDTWGIAACAQALLHELNHVIRDHTRRYRTGSFEDRDRWNVAADLEINDDLCATGQLDALSRVMQPLLPVQFGFENGLLSETYYLQLPVSVPEMLMSGCGGGSGVGERNDFEPTPSGDERLSGMTEGELNVLRHKIACDVLKHQQLYGNVPGGVRRWAELQLTPPKVPWQQVLRAAVKQSVHVAIGQGDVTYRRPPRRRVPGVILPAHQRKAPTVAVAIDTSASMETPQLQQAISEINGALGALGRSALRMFSVDTVASKPKTITNVSQIQLEGGGGTDMRIAIEELNALHPKPDLNVIITDGYTLWPDRPQPGAPQLIIIIIGTQDVTNRFPPPAFATTVTIEPERDGHGVGV